MFLTLQTLASIFNFLIFNFFIARGNLISAKMEINSGTKEKIYCENHRKL